MAIESRGRQFGIGPLRRGSAGPRIPRQVRQLAIPQRDGFRSDVDQVSGVVQLPRPTCSAVRTSTRSRSGDLQVTKPVQIRGGIRNKTAHATGKRWGGPKGEPAGYAGTYPDILSGQGRSGASPGDVLDAAYGRQALSVQALESARSSQHHRGRSTALYGHRPSGPSVRNRAASTGIGRTADAAGRSGSWPSPDGGRPSAFVCRVCRHHRGNGRGVAQWFGL